MNRPGPQSRIRKAARQAFNSILLLSRFLEFVRPYRRAGVLMLLTMGAESVLALVQPLVYRRLIDDVLGASAAAASLRLLALYLAILAALRLGSWLSGNLHLILQTRAIHGTSMDIENAVYRKLDALPILYHDRHTAGENLRHLYGDPGTVTGFLLHLAPTTLEVLTRGVAALVIITATLWWAGAVALIPVIPVALMGVWSGRHFERLSQMVFARSKKLYMHVLDILHGVRLVRGFGRALSEQARFTQLQRRLRSAQLAQGYSQAWLSSAMSILAQAGGAVVFIVGAVALVVWRARGRTDFSLGDLFMLLGYVLQLSQPIAWLGQLSGDLGNAGAAARRLRAILDEPEMVPVPGNKEPPGGVESAIVFEHVHFGYHPGQEVLRDVSFEIRPGEVVGLLGANGSGKTTLAGLICGFYVPREGDVRVCGLPAHRASTRPGPRLVSLAPQDAPLLRRTIRQNLAYGRPTATDAEIWEALELVRMASAVKALPHALNTRVGEGCDVLSAGQRQRLSLARAMVSSAHIIVLDEAMSWIDAEDRDRIWAALRSMSQRPAFLVISHHERLTGVVDRVLALESGTVRSAPNQP